MTPLQKESHDSHIREEMDKTSECCDGECNHDDCCGKIPENCTHKESPVSQSVEGWEPTLEWWRNHGLKQCNYDECYCQSAYEIALLSTTLSTLVTKMEGLEEERWVEHGRDCIEGRRPCGAIDHPAPLADRCENKSYDSKTLSASIEVVKKMV